MIGAYILYPLPLTCEATVLSPVELLLMCSLALTGGNRVSQFDFLHTSVILHY